MLVKHYLDLFNKKYNTEKQLSLSALEVLTQYSWPGNIRELENLIERLVIIINDNVINHNHLRGLLDKKDPVILPPSVEYGLSLPEAVSAVERQLLSRALSFHGSTRKAAKALGVSQPTVVRKARKYGIKLDE